MRHVHVRWLLVLGACVSVLLAGAPRSSAAGVTPTVPPGLHALTASTASTASTGAPAGGVLRAITVGGYHTCGLIPTGVAYCWGWNSTGQLGDGRTAERSAPVAVAGALTWNAITAGGGGSGGQTCGLTTAGVAYCWGNNSSGQLGDGSTTNRTVPVAVASGLTWQSLTAGEYHTCGLIPTGVAYCWGGNNVGQLGDGSTTNRTTPVAVAGALTWNAIIARGSGYFGGSHTCGVTSAGVAYCWGNNYYGELGDGSIAGRTVPVAVAGGLTWQSLTAGVYHTCGVTSAGVAYCWGNNYFGQLGDGNPNYLNPNYFSTVPVAVAGGLTWQSLAAGEYHTCGLTSAGVAYCWGNTTGRNSPVAVAGGLTWQSLTAGREHTCGLTSAGVAYCWGGNYFSQLGDGSTTYRSAPVAVAGLPAASAYRIVGWVRAGNGQGVAGATVSLDGGNRTATDAAGTYLLSGVAAGTHTVSVSKTGYTITPPSRTVSVSADVTGLGFFAAPLPMPPVLAASTGERAPTAAQTPQAVPSRRVATEWVARPTPLATYGVGPASLSFPIDRYYGLPNGIAAYCPKGGTLIAASAANTTARLALHLFDVDAAEQYIVRVNPASPTDDSAVIYRGPLQGVNNDWATASLAVPAGKLARFCFPNGGTVGGRLVDPVANVVTIELDSASAAAGWKFQAAWAKLDLDGPLPIMLMAGLDPRVFDVLQACVGLSETGGYWDAWKLGNLPSGGGFLFEDGLFGHIVERRGDQYIEVQYQDMDRAYTQMRSLFGPRDTSIPLQINIVGHSMGGLTGRYFITQKNKNPAIPVVDKLVMFGTPNLGSYWADLLVYGRVQTIFGSFSTGINTNAVCGSQAIEHLTRQYLVDQGFNQRTALTQGYWASGAVAEHVISVAVDHRYTDYKLTEQTRDTDQVVSVGSMHGLTYADNATTWTCAVLAECGIPLHSQEARLREIYTLTRDKGRLREPFRPSYPLRASIASSQLRAQDTSTVTPTSDWSVVSLQGSTANPGQTAHASFTLDAVDRIDVAVSQSGSGTVTFTLRDPTGASVPALGMRRYSVESPRAGIWTVDVNGTSLAAAETYAVQVFAQAALSATLQPAASAYAAGETVPLTLTLRDGVQPLRGATVTASMRRPDGTETAAFTLFDDGAHGDGAAGDGVYGGSVVASTQPGRHTVSALVAGTRPGVGGAFTRIAGTQFDVRRPGAALSRTITSSVVDADGDGLFDSLTIVGTAGVTTAGSYQLQASLAAGDGTEIATITQDVPLAASSASAWSASFGGRLLAASGKDGPYTVKGLRLASVDSSGSVLLADELASAHTTAGYTAVQFQREALTLGVITDQGLDTDGDGRFNLLRLAVSVNVVTAGSYPFSASLTDAAGNGVASLSGTATLTAGANTLLLDFNGYDIWQSGRDGPYTLTAFSLLPATSSVGALHLSQVYTTGTAYARSQFDAFHTLATTVSPANGGTVSISPTGVDGRYDDSASVTLTATASAGFHFVRWTENGTTASTANSYQTTMNADHALTAEFAIGGTTAQTLNLASGWNLATLRVTPSQTSPTALVTTSSNTIDILIGFDAAAGQARAYFTDPAKAVLNSLTALEAGAGYWVHTTQAATVAVTGTAPAGSVTRSLAEGWNLAGWQGADRRTLSAALGSLLGSDVDILIGFDAAAGQAKAYFTDPAKAVLNSLTHLEVGGGYWVHTTKATTWAYAP